MLPVQEEATLSGFTDNLILVVTAMHRETVEVCTTKTVTILLYPSLVWTEAFANSQIQKQVDSSYLADSFEGLQRFPNYTRSVSIGVAGVIPANFLAREISMLYHAKCMEVTTLKNVARYHMISANADGVNLRRIIEPIGLFPTLEYSLG